MESFFLAETTKYLYLLFDPDNILNNNGGTGTIIDTPNGECIIEAGGYVFNTEAHPIDMGALNCCYNTGRENLLANYDTKKFLGDIFEFTNKENDGDFEQRSSKFNETNALLTTTITVPLTTQTATIDTKTVDAEETRKKIVAEIMSVLKENKFNRENGQSANVPAQVLVETETASIPETTTPASLVDDSIIVPIEKPAENESVTVEDPVEVVKLPAASYEEENSSTESLPTDVTVSHQQQQATVLHHQQDANKIVPKPNISEVELKSFFSQHDKYVDELQSTTDATSSENKSMLTEFVHSILKSTLPPKPKFNPQDLLEKIRANGMNRTYNKNYKLLTCKAQPYLQRITVLGEFF